MGRDNESNELNLPSLFFFFFGHDHDTRKFLGQGLNLCHE